MNNLVRDHKSFFFWVLGTTALSLLLLWYILPVLDYYPILTDDEGRILSAAHTLAAHGRFGSDLYQGAWGSDSVLFTSLPVQRVLIAAAFRLAGESISNARAVTLIGALVLLWSLGLFGWQLYGTGAALVGGFLLVAWRSYIGSDELGMLFIETTRSARYDLTAVALIWLSLASLTLYLARPTRLTAVVTGLTAGLATLTQFFGGFVLVVILLTLVIAHKKTPLRTRPLVWMAAGLGIVLVPYAITIAANFDSFVAQTLVLKASRARFADPLFYLHNFLAEGERYARIAARAFQEPGLAARAAAWLSFAIILAACLNLLRRIRRSPTAQEWILPLTLIVFAPALALVESTKASLYAIVLYPSICLALGVLWNDLCHIRPERAFRLAGAAVTVLLVLAVLVKFNDALNFDRIHAARARRYTFTVTKILRALPQSASILTSARMAWGLRDLSPDTTTFLAIQWRLAGTSNLKPALLSELVERRIRYLVLDDAAFVDFQSDANLNAQAFDLINRCTTRRYRSQDSSYGILHIYQLKPDVATC